MSILRLVVCSVIFFTIYPTSSVVATHVGKPCVDYTYGPHQFSATHNYVRTQSGVSSIEELIERCAVICKTDSSCDIWVARTSTSVLSPWVCDVYKLGGTRGYTIRITGDRHAMGYKDVNDNCDGVLTSAPTNAPTPVRACVDYTYGPHPFSATHNYVRTQSGVSSIEELIERCAVICKTDSSCDIWVARTSTSVLSPWVCDVYKLGGTRGYTIRITGDRWAIGYKTCRGVESYSPTLSPSISPSMSPTTSPSTNPTVNPTKSPSISPSMSPTTSPSTNPTVNPTKSPSISPSMSPTTSPSTNPTVNPTKSPTMNPTRSPTANPTRSPTKTPTVSPTMNPTSTPTVTCMAPKIVHGSSIDCTGLAYLETCTVSGNQGFTCNNNGATYQCSDTNTWTLISGAEVAIDNYNCWLDCTFPGTLQTGAASPDCVGNQILHHGDSCTIELLDNTYACENLGEYVCLDGAWVHQSVDVAMNDVACKKKCELPILTEGMHTSCQGVLITSGTTCDLIPDNETVACAGPEIITCSDGSWFYGTTPYNPALDSDCDIDCVESNWSDWGSCSRICGTGFQIATRTILVQPALGGRECGSLFKTQDCNTFECKCNANIVAGLDSTFQNRGRPGVQFALARAQLLELVGHLGDAIHRDRAHMQVNILGPSAIHDVVRFGSSASQDSSVLMNELSTALFNFPEEENRNTAFLEFLRNAVQNLNELEGENSFIVLFSDGLPAITNARNKKGKNYINEAKAIVKGEDAPNGLKLVCYRVTARSAFNAFFKDGICDILWDFSEGTNENSVTSKTRNVIGYEMANFLCPDLETHEQGDDGTETIVSTLSDPCEGIRSPKECVAVRKMSDGSDPREDIRGVQFCTFVWTDDVRKCTPLDKYINLFDSAQVLAIQSTDKGILAPGPTDPCFAEQSRKRCGKIKVELPSTATVGRLLGSKKHKKSRVCEWDKSNGFCNLKEQYVVNYIECASLNQATCESYPIFCNWNTNLESCQPNNTT